MSQSLLFVGARAGMSADDSDHRVTQEFQEDMDMFDWTISDEDMTILDAIGPSRPVRTCIHLCVRNVLQIGVRTC